MSPSASASAARASRVRLPGQLSRPLESEHAHVGRLSMALVGAARLPELRLVSRHVEDVVDDLEHHAKLGREAPVRDCGRSRPVPSSARIAPTDAAISAPGLQLVQAAQVGRRSEPPTSRNCPPTMPSTPAAPDHLAHGGQHRRGLALLLAQRQAQRLREETVAGEDRHVLAEGHVTGGLAAPQLVVVHRRQVVVDQRVGVDHLDRGGERQHLLRDRGRAPRRWRARAPGRMRLPPASSE